MSLYSWRVTVIYEGPRGESASRDIDVEGDDIEEALENTDELIAPDEEIVEISRIEDDEE